MEGNESIVSGKDRKYGCGFTAVAEYGIDIEIPSNLVTLQSGISNRHSRTKSDTINGNVYNENDGGFLKALCVSTGPMKKVYLERFGDYIYVVRKR